MKSGKGTFLLSLICVLVLLLAPLGVQADGPTPPLREATRPLPQRVPDELVERLAGGVSIEEFLEMSGWRVPMALAPYVDYEVTVIIELDRPPLATLRAGGELISAAAQRDYLKTLEAEQSALEPRMEALGARVISRYTKVYNGFLLRAPLNKLAEIRELPGVKAIHRAPEHHLDLSASVPLIRANEIWSSLGYDGDGVTVAVIDTGIDYTHAALGGSGDPNDYANNDPDVVEPGSFPTAKVIGGYDFAGTKYNAGCSAANEAAGICSKTPAPDPDPLDENGHGTHVASTIAGVGVPGEIGVGVAPAAKLYALKVFGASGSTNLTIDAIEWAMDPNGDGDMSDHVDVINMSLGADYGPNDPSDPEIVAVNNAAALGVIVVAAAGNAGDTSYIVGTPAVADSAIAVAASATGYALAPTLSISGTSAVTLTNIIYQPSSFDNNTGHFTQTVTATLFYVGTVTTDTLCTTDGITADLSGQVALIQRGGDCAFSTKVNNAASLGAVAAIIFNHSSGGNARATMVGDPVSIPAGFVAHDDGVNLATAHGQTVVIDAESNRQLIADPYNPADTIASFSSRGPRGYDSYLKPDVTAPGVGIYAAAMGEGTGGVSMQGTSMATPHVAGVAALIRQAHPTWTPEQVKAAMMNTAVDLVSGAVVPRQGAGRVDAYRAISADVLAIGDPDLVSLNWGLLEIETDSYADVKTVSLRSFTSASKVYSVTWSFATGSIATGISLAVPMTVSVPAYGLASVPVTLNVDATQLENDFGTLEECYGFVTFTNTSMPTDTLRVPFYLVPRPYTRLTEAGADMSFDAASGVGYVDLLHTGPISSSLWAYPALVVDANETTQGDMGDVRLVGMDYLVYDSEDKNDLFLVAIASWGAWHTPQPYFGEFDLYLDVDEDGTADLIDFNWNLGALDGGDDNDTWIVAQFDPSTLSLGLASGYTIYTDYAAGIMEWILPAGMNGLENVTTGGTNTDFEFQVVGWDADGNSDPSAAGRFDYARSPFAFGYLVGSGLGPNAREAIYGLMVNDLGGYLYSKPKGMMLIDYAGKPGMGQVYYWPVEVTGYPRLFLPMVFSN